MATCSLLAFPLPLIPIADRLLLKISAVVPVHVFGLPAKIIKIKEICSNWGLPLIEDAAEALGSRVLEDNQKIHCGCFGDLGAISFNGNKIITSGSGGAVITLSLIHI